MIVLGFNDMSTFVGHFVSSPREWEKRDRRDSRRDEKRDREERGTGMKEKKLEMFQYDTNAPIQGHSHPQAGIQQKMKLKNWP